MTAVNVVMSSSLIRTRIPSGGSLTKSASCLDTSRRTEERVQGRGMDRKESGKRRHDGIV